MAVLIIAHIPAGTAELDEEIQKNMSFAANPPAGFMARLAGPVEGGWRVISVWESQEAFDTFRREQLEPAWRQAGRPMPQLQSSPLHSVRINPQQR